MKEIMYKYSNRYANLWGEVEEWMSSAVQNMKCKLKIEEEIANNFHDNTLDVETAVSNVLEVFTLERVVYILAVTAKHKLWDSRLSSMNRSWGNRVIIPDIGKEECYVVDGCNTGLVNLFIDKVLELEGALGIFEEERK